MNIKHLLIIFALMCAMPVFAEFKLGVKGGYSTTLSPSAIGDAKWASVSPKNARGFHIGMFARIGNKLYFQPELLYEREVNENTFVPSAQGEIKQLSTTSAVGVPLLFGWRMFQIGNGFSMRFVIGPKVRLDIGSHTKYSTGENTWSPNDNYVDALRQCAVGLDTGLGIELMNIINFEVRYNLIGDLRKTTTINALGNAISTHYKDPLNTFNVSIGLKLWK